MQPTPDQDAAALTAAPRRRNPAAAGLAWMGRSAAQAWPAAVAAAFLIALLAAAVELLDIDAYVLPAPLDVVIAAFDPDQQELGWRRR